MVFGRAVVSARGMADARAAAAPSSEPPNAADTSSAIIASDWRIWLLASKVDACRDLATDGTTSSRLVVLLYRSGVVSSS
jgi:hypothetical protein